MKKKIKLTPEEAAKIKERIVKAAKKGIIWSPDVKVRQHREQVDVLMRKIAELFYCKKSEDVEDWLRHCFTSDESTLADFLDSEQEVQYLSDVLGFPVESRNYIWEVALRMKPAS